MPPEQDGGKPDANSPNIAADRAGGKNQAVGPALRALAEMKKLPADWLAALGVRDGGSGRIVIPYFDPDGNLLFERVRNPEGSEVPFRQPTNVKPVPYGRWLLGNARKEGLAWLTEGESDCWTLLSLGLPALGVPGAGTVKHLSAADLDGIAHLYAVPDNDRGGEQFVEGLVKRLVNLQFTGRAWRLRVPAGIKDVSDWYIGNPGEFLAALAESVKTAEPLVLRGAFDGPPVPREPSQRDVSPNDPPEPWGQPVPLGELTAPPCFPLEALPEPLRLFCTTAADALPCPVDYVAVPLLVVAGAALGASRALEIKDGYVQGASLYAAVIGPPGTTKTPALSTVVAPAEAIEEKITHVWRKAMEDHQSEKDIYETKLKEWKKDAQGERPAAPVRPALERLIVDDATVEALAFILSENPRGMALVKDELAGWVGGMNQYRSGGKGNDQQFFLSAWSSAAVTVDRRKDSEKGPLRVAHPFLSIVGGLTPDNLPLLRGDSTKKKATDDGFADRILFSWPMPSPVVEETWTTIPEDVRAVWASAYARLRHPQMIDHTQDGMVTGQRPVIVRLSADARTAYQRFTADHAAEVNAESFPAHLRGPWSKLKGYWGRLALIVHYLRWAVGEVASDRSDVDAESARRSSLLVAYFKGMARRVYDAMSADPRLVLARKVWAWIVRKWSSAPPPASFKAWEATRDLQSNALPTVEKAEEVLQLLREHNHIRARARADRPGPGRKPAVEWEVNPLALQQRVGTEEA